MAALSGKFGIINGASGVRNWRLSVESNPPMYRASNTKIGTGRLNGQVNWNGSFEHYGLSPLVLPGQEFSFAGYTAPSNDTKGGTGSLYSGIARVSEVSLNWNWRDNEPPSTSVAFQAAGILAENLTGADPTDVSIPEPSSICGLKIQYNHASVGPSAVYTWPNIARATLRFSADNPIFSNSSTISGGFCYVDSVQGPLDFDLTIVEDNQSMHDVRGAGTAFNPGDDLRLLLYVDAATFWLLEWAKIDSFSDLTVEIDTGRVIEQTVNLKMNGFYNGVEGQIVHPNTSILWPLF